PFKTINAAAQVATPGTTIYVKSGVYSEAVVFSNSGTQNAPISLKSYPNHSAVLDGMTSIDYPLLTANASWIVFERLEVRNARHDGIHLSDHSNNVVIRNCKVHHNAW